MQRSWPALGVVLGLVLGSTGVKGQSAASLRAGPATYVALGSLTPERPTISPFAELDARPESMARGKRREGTVLMIVGLAGIITGLAVDESLVTIAGAGVAGVGLYLYLNNDGTIHVDP